MLPTLCLSEGTIAVAACRALPGRMGRVAGLVVLTDREAKAQVPSFGVEVLSSRVMFVAFGEPGEDGRCAGPLVAELVADSSVPFCEFAFLLTS